MIFAIGLNILFKKNFKENFEVITMKRDEATNKIKENQKSLSTKNKQALMQEKVDKMEKHLDKLKQSFALKKDLPNLEKKQLQNWSSWDSRDIHKKQKSEPAGSYEQKTNNVKWPLHNQSCGITNDLVGCKNNNKIENKNPEYLNEIDDSTYEKVNKVHSTCYPYPLRQQGCIRNSSNKIADIFCKKCEDGKPRK